MFHHTLHQQRLLAAQANPMSNVIELSRATNPQPTLLRETERRYFGKGESKVFRLGTPEKTYLRNRFSPPGIA